MTGSSSPSKRVSYPRKPELHLESMRHSWTSPDPAAIKRFDRLATSRARLFTNSHPQENEGWNGDSSPEGQDFVPGHRLPGQVSNGDRMRFQKKRRIMKETARCLNVRASATFATAAAKLPYPGLPRISLSVFKSAPPVIPAGRSAPWGDDRRAEDRVPLRTGVPVEIRRNRGASVRRIAPG